jgi:hypothetical protein
MSLGAIDFGMIVDGAVVMMENSVHRLEEHGGKESLLDSVRLAGYEVARPMAFAVTIIIAVYLPILFLQGMEGRMFRPMAITVCAALVGSLILALTMVPTLTSFSFRGYAQGVHSKKGGQHRLMDSLGRAYIRMLIWAMKHRILTATLAVVPVKCILRPVAAGRPPTRKSVKARTRMDAATPLTDDVVAFCDQIRCAPEIKVRECGTEISHERHDILAAAPRFMQRVLQQHIRRGNLIDDS